jgi:hypothetical protein
MTTAQYRTAIKKLGLKIFTAGPVLGISGRQSQRYAAGDAIPETVVKLIACYLEHGIPEGNDR